MESIERGSTMEGEVCLTNGQGDNGNLMVRECDAIQNQFELMKQAQEKENKKWFEILGPASILYALIYTLCSYHNTAGIAIPVWIAAQIGYVYYVTKKLGGAWKRGSLFIASMMVLLGISSFLTGNVSIHIMNYIGHFALLIVLILNHFYDVSAWGIDKMILEVMISVFGAIGEVGSPFAESAAFVRSRERGKVNKVYTVGIGILISIPLLFVAGLCLASADAVFASLFKGIPHILMETDMIIKIPFMLFFGYFSSYCGIHFIAKRKRPDHDLQYKKHSSLIAVTFTSTLAIMYGVFSGIQVIYLFFGYGELPKHMTYAEYARTGFFELLFVVAMNIFLVLLTKRAFQDSKVLKMILMIICFCTYIMIASSAYRMVLYIRAYHLTFLRVFVLVSLALFALLIAGVVAYLQKENFPLFRYSLVVVCVVYIGFSLSHVDYWIGAYNIQHMTQENETEILDYFKCLSSDAAPVIQEYVNKNPELMNEIAEAIESEKDPHNKSVYYSSVYWYIYYRDTVKDCVDNMGIRGFNLSYYLAQKQVLVE